MGCPPLQEQGVPLVLCVLLLLGAKGKPRGGWVLSHSLVVFLAVLWAGSLLLPRSCSEEEEEALPPGSGSAKGQGLSALCFVSSSSTGKNGISVRAAG